MSKINFRSLKLKSHEEYLTVEDIFWETDLIFQLKRQVGKGERNDKKTRKSKIKAF